MTLTIDGVESKHGLSGHASSGGGRVNTYESALASKMQTPEQTGSTLYMPSMYDEEDVSDDEPLASSHRTNKRRN